MIGNTMREPERERLSLILNELGTGVAGRGGDLNEVIRRANPALQETDKVLEILAEQNPCWSSWRSTPTPCWRRSPATARGRGRDPPLQQRGQGDGGEARRARGRHPDAAAFLDELKPTMVRLGALADASTPVFTDLGAQAPAINAWSSRLGPFSQAAIPAVDSLGEASKTGMPAVTDARPVIADLRSLANAVRPVGVTLRQVLESFRDTGGIERLMDYIFYQAAAINGFDAVGHYLRAELIVNQCANYAVEPVAGCSANFASRPPRRRRGPARSRAPAMIPCCGAPRSRSPGRSAWRSRRPRRQARPRTSQAAKKQRKRAKAKPRDGKAARRSRRAAGGAGTAATPCRRRRAGRRRAGRPRHRSPPPRRRRRRPLGRAAGLPLRPGRPDERPRRQGSRATRC